MAEDKDDKQELKPYFEFKVPGAPVAFKVGGREVGVIILAAFLGYAVYEHDRRSEAAMTTMTQALRENSKAITNFSSVQAGVLYTLTLSQEERKKLDLTKPTIIRELERRRDDR